MEKENRFFKLNKFFSGRLGRWFWAVGWAAVLAAGIFFFFGPNGVGRKNLSEKNEAEKIWKERNTVIVESQLELDPAPESLFSDFSPFEKKSAAGVFGKEIGSAEQLKNELAAVEGEGKFFLKAGNYRVNLEAVGKKIVLTGENEKTILEPENPGQALLKISGGEAELQGLVLKNGRIGLESEKSKVKLSQVLIENFSATGLFLFDCRLEAEKIQTLACGSGVKAKRSRGWMKNSVFEANAKTGVELLESSRFQIENNKISRNGSYGLFADETSRAALKGNYIRGNAGFNIRLQKEEKIFQ